MSDRIDFSSFRDNAPIITISLSGRDANICVFFSMNCCTKMFEHHEQGDDFRTAFAKSVFLMFQNTECNDGEGLTETDFLSASDDSLLLVLNVILEQDDKLKNEYDKATGSSAYEQFFAANESILKNATAGLSKSFERISGIFESQNKLLSTSLGNALSNLTIPHDCLPGLTPAISNMPRYELPQFHSALTGIPKIPPIEISSAMQSMSKINFAQLQSALVNVPQIQYPELASVIANIPQPVINVQAMLAPLQALEESAKRISEDCLQVMQSSLLQFATATQSILSNMDFSLLTYRKEWSAQRETLLKYDWFYSDELPDELVNYIHDNQESLSTDEVNKLIIGHFRNDRCKALKMVVKRWDELPYFTCRKRIFHEALVNHSRRYFNSSVTLLTVHTEGVITDFVRTSLDNPRYKVEKAIEDIKRELEKSNDVSIYEYEVFNDVIEQIEAAFTENFKHSNPDATSNESRHKIAHGHAYQVESEVNSLKKFLYLNELYSLFLYLGKKIQE